MNILQFFHNFRLNLVQTKRGFSSDIVQKSKFNWHWFSIAKIKVKINLGNNSKSTRVYFFNCNILKCLTVNDCNFITLMNILPDIYLLIITCHQFFWKCQSINSHFYFHFIFSGSCLSHGRVLNYSSNPIPSYRLRNRNVEMRGRCAL